MSAATIERPADGAETGEVETLIRRLLKEQVNPADAAKTLAEMAREDNDLYRTIVGENFHTLCYRIVSDIHRHDRRLVWQGTPAARPASLTLWTAEVSAGLMDSFTLPSGKLLGDATREILVVEASAYQTRAADMLVKAKFLTLIANAMPNKGTVREKLTEDRLVALRSDARATRGAA